MDLVRILVESGADVDKSTDKGLTPLHQAVRRNHLREVSRFLVDSGANINKRDEIGFAPLHYAVTRQDIDLTRFLVESGAEVNSKTNTSFTPLHFSAIIENLEFAGYFINLELMSMQRTVRVRQHWRTLLKLRMTRLFVISQIKVHNRVVNQLKGDLSLPLRYCEHILSVVYFLLLIIY